MGKYFTLTELIRSDTAKANGLDNEPPMTEAYNLVQLIKVLDKIRERWGEPIYVNSGYRSPEVNKKVGGVATSQHVKGEAADITTRDVSKNKKLFELIIKMQEEGDIQFDQLIDEKKYSWLHISHKLTNNRKQILHL